jgi:hypothetical protein
MTNIPLDKLESLGIIKLSSSRPCGYLAFYSPSAPQGLLYWMKKARRYVEIMHGSTKERSEIDCKWEISDKNR